MLNIGYGQDGIGRGRELRMKLHESGVLADIEAAAEALAGKAAVGQQFEAEAGDELQAAEAALRRVVLWRAAGTTR